MWLTATIITCQTSMLASCCTSRSREEELEEERPAAAALCWAAAASVVAPTPCGSAIQAAMEQLSNKRR